jgi:serine/threonine protein phosphatase PrpC
MHAAFMDVASHLQTVTLEAVVHAMRRLFLKPLQPWDSVDALPTGRQLTSTTQQLAIATRSGHHGAIGVRPRMEDAAASQEGISIPELGISGAAFYCIFDGHSGEACATYAAAQYSEVLLSHVRISGNWSRAQFEAFCALDAVCLSASQGRDDTGAAAISVVFDGVNK